jgi:choline dehydrogenase
MKADVVIIGGGTTGCVLAGRLSERADRSVLLLEAGPDFPGGVGELPSDIRREECAVPRDDYLWTYSALLNSRSDRRIPAIRGKLTGGSGAVNGAIFQRGLPEDYDAWGSPLWRYDALLPYFRAYEHDVDFDGPLHGAAGPVPVRRVPRGDWAASQRALYDSALANGHPAKEDMTAPDGSGVGPLPRNGEAGVRMSAALTHLQPARARENLTVLSGAHATRLRFDGRRATGVEVRSARDGDLLVEGEQLILAAGTIETPHLLLLSGVGPEAALRRLGIEPVIDLPGVGRNLRDHPVTPIEVTGPGAGEDPRHQVVLVCTATGSPRRNDIHIILSNIVTLDEQGERADDLLMVSAILQSAASSGELTLASADPFEPPRIVFHYLEDEFDRSRLREATRIAARLVDHRSFADLGIARVAPADEVLASDRQLDGWIEANVSSLLHGCGTCRMGDAADPDAVVDDRGRVRGLDRLRIADLSIAPDVPRAPTNATAFVIAERMAALFDEDDQGGMP